MNETSFPDERLELIFTCCHPALGLEAQVALTLRALGGLRTDEIARAFLVPEETMKRRLSRAKRKITDAGIPFRVPADRTAAGAAGGGARGRLSDLQRGLRRPRRSGGRGAPARRGARRADAGRVRGARPASADAARRRAPRRPVPGRRARAARRAGQDALGHHPARPRTPGARSRLRAPGTGRVRAPGGDRVAAHGRAARLVADRRALRRARPADRFARSSS